MKSFVLFQLLFANSAEANANIAVSSRGTYAHQHEKKGSYTFRCTKGQKKQEVHEHDIKTRVDRYFSRVTSEDSGKYSVWNVADVIPFCRAAICGEDSGESEDKSTHSSKKQKSANKKPHSHADKQKKGEHDSAEKDDHDNAEKGDHDSAEKGDHNDSAEKGDHDDSAEKGDHDDNKDDEEKEGHDHDDKQEEREPSALQTGESSSSSEAKQKVAFEPIIPEATLSLCISHYYSMRCDKQKKNAPNEGETLSLQCLLAEQNAPDHKYLDEDIVEQLEDLEEHTKGHVHKNNALCKDSNIGIVTRETPMFDGENDDALDAPDAVSDGSDVEIQVEGEEHNKGPSCDFSREFENLVYRKLPDMDREVGHRRCKDMTSETPRYREWGSPSHVPQWQVPKIECNETHADGEESMAVQLLARKHRLSYMQQWFAKMETDVFHGEGQWFVANMQNYTPKFHPRKQVSRMSSLVDRIKRASARKADGAGERRDILDEELDLLRSMDDEDSEKKTGQDLYNPTRSRRTLMSWYYRISTLQTESVIGKSTMIEFYDWMKDLDHDFLLALHRPDVVGHTHWLDYLQSTGVWDAAFWRLISPANYYRLLAQAKVTMDMCKQLGLSTRQYRPHTHTDLRYIVRDQIGHGQEEAERHFPTDLGTCSLTLIATRLEAIMRAHEEAGRILKTDKYEPKSSARHEKEEEDVRINNTSSNMPNMYSTEHVDANMLIISNFHTEHERDQAATQQDEATAAPYTSTSNDVKQHHGTDRDHTVAAVVFMCAFLSSALCVGFWMR